MAKKKSKPKQKTKISNKKKKRKRRIVVQSRPIRSKAISIEDVLKKINHVQVERENVSFIVSKDDSFVIENILNDAGVVFSKDAPLKGDSNEVYYEVSPGELEEEGLHALDQLEELDDEILEDGQIF